MRCEASAYPPLWRIASAALVAIGRGSPLVLLIFTAVFDTRLNNPLRLMRVFAAVCLAPQLVAWIVRRMCAATLTSDADALVVEQRNRRIEIPYGAVDRVSPWTIPLPADGVWLHLKSGRRFLYGLQTDDLAELIEALADGGAAAEVRTALRDPAVIYARARRTVSKAWNRPLVKFGLFSLVPTLPIFRLHQWITYGGTFGEYYSYGLKAYLLAFGIYWASTAIHLVFYAALLRGVTEGVARVAAHVAPPHATEVRRAAEIAHRILYYAGVPAFLVWRLLQ